MNKFKLLLPVLTLLLLTIGIVFGADSTPTLSTASEQTFTGTKTVTITIAGNSNITGVVVFGRAGTSGAWTVLGSNSTSANLTTYTVSIDSTLLSDSYSAEMNVTSQNYTMLAGSQANLSSAVVSVNYDNTAPTLSYLVGKTNVESSGFTSFTCTIQNEGSSNNTVNVHLENPQGVRSTQSSSVGSFSGVLRFTGRGTYTTSCVVLDGQGQGTSSSNTTLRASADIPLGAIGQQSQEQVAQTISIQKTQMNKGLIAGIITIILALVVVIFVAVRKKSKRRR